MTEKKKHTEDSQLAEKQTKAASQLECYTHDFPPSWTLCDLMHCSPLPLHQHEVARALLSYS